MKLMRKALLIASIMSVICLCFTTMGIADDSLADVQANGQIKVGFCAQYPPFESKNEANGEFEGFDVDLGKALASEMGLDVHFIDAEWQGLLAGLSKGDFDMLITCMSKSETRGQNVNFSDVYYELPDVIVVRKDDGQISSIDDLKGRVVGVQIGSGSEQVADKMADHFKDIRRYNYNPEAFTDLKYKRIDAVLVGYAYAVTQMKTDPAYKVVGEPIAKAEVVIVLPQGSDALTAKVNEALAQIRSNGTYSRIHDQWLKVN